MGKFTDAVRAALKGYFETGDVPTASQYADLMDKIQDGIQEHDHKSTGGAGSGTGDAGQVSGSDISGAVDDSDHLEGSTLAQVRNHTPNTHGPSEHTDQTRYLFLPAYGYCSGGEAVLDLRHTAKLRDSQTDHVAFVFRVPDDFVSFGSVKAVWVCQVAAGNMDWTLHARYAASGEISSTHFDEPAEGTTANGGANKINVQEPANALSLSSLAKGDYVGIVMYRYGAEDADTINSDVMVYGLLFEYTAEQ